MADGHSLERCPGRRHLGRKSQRARLPMQRATFARELLSHSQCGYAWISSIVGREECTRIARVTRCETSLAVDAHRAPSPLA